MKILGRNIGVSLVDGKKIKLINFKLRSNLLFVSCQIILLRDELKAMNMFLLILLPWTSRIESTDRSRIS